MSSTTVNGGTPNDMEEDANTGVMDLCMRVTGRTIWPVVKDD